MNLLVDHVFVNGREQPAFPAVPLRAGPVHLLFDPNTGMLRHARVGDHEMIRAIYGAVRDSQWNTIRPAIQNIQIQSEQEHFELSFDALCIAGPINFAWKAIVVGKPSGAIEFRFSGQARSTFLKNRIGLCVLHPIAECAGRSCTVETTSGETAQGNFPEHVAPHQPFKNVRAIAHDPAPGLSVRIEFQGDTFEMEDQRNWGDASFKTYSTPLDLPFPAEIAAGTSVEQTVSISVQMARKILPVLAGRTPQFSISTTPILPKPSIGLCQARQQPALPQETVARLRSLRLSHLRVEFVLNDPQLAAQLSHASAEAAQLNVPLHAAIYVRNPEPELDNLSRLASDLRMPVALWLVHHLDHPVTPEPLFRLAREKLSPIANHALFAAGTAAEFAQLNRHPLAPGMGAIPTYALSPQVHQFDDLTLIENLEAQPSGVHACQKFSPQAVALSPITLRPRKQPAQGWDNEIDPRQFSLFLAGWTIGSIGRLAVTRSVHSISYFETVGPCGIAGHAAMNTVLPQAAHLANAVYPVFFVFAAMAGFDRICPTHSSHPLQTEALTLLNAENRRRVLLANLQSGPLEVKIKSGTCQGHVQILNARNLMEALQAPESFLAAEGTLLDSAGGKLSLELDAHAFAIIDLTN